jgi:hypothetical protein
MPTLQETARAFLKKKGWAFEASAKGSALRLGFEGKNGRWPCYIECNDTLGQVVFFSVRQGAVPEDQRAAVAEYLMRVNCQLNVASFELHFDEGLVRCRSGIDVDGHTFDEALMSNLALLNVATMDKFMPGIDAVLSGTGPQSAFEAVRDAA